MGNLVAGLQRGGYSMEDRIQQMKLAARAASLRARPETKVFEAKGGCLCTHEIKMSTLLTQWDKHFFCASFSNTLDTSAIYRITAYQPCCCADGWGFISSADHFQPLFMMMGEADKSFKAVVDNVIVAQDGEPNEVIYSGPAVGCMSERNYEITNHKIVGMLDQKCGCCKLGTHFDAVWLPTISNYTLVTPLCELCCRSLIVAYPHSGPAIVMEVPDAKTVYGKLVALHKRRMASPFASAAATLGNGQIMVPSMQQPVNFVSLPNNVVVPSQPAMARTDADDKKS